MTEHTHFSSYREKLIEHLFLGDLLKLSWLKYKCSLEIARPEVDNSGYDAIAEANGIVRHIQIKTSVVGGKTASQKIHRKLAVSPAPACSGSTSMKRQWNSGRTCTSAHRNLAGQWKALSVVRRPSTPRATKMGSKQSERTYASPKGAFSRLSSLEAVYEQLFGVV